MLIPTDKIYFPAKKRLRVDYGDLEDFSQSFPVVGQIASVIVRKYDPALDDPDEHGFDWTLDDGGRRLVTVRMLHAKGRSIPGVPVGMIRADLKEDVERDDLQNLLIEFYANDRKEFDWKEKAEFVRRVHDIGIIRTLDHRDDTASLRFGKLWLDLTKEQQEEIRTDVDGFIEEWTVAHTAASLRMSENGVYQYLQITKDEDVYQHQEIQEADTLRTAVKKSKMVRDRKKREKALEHFEQQIVDANGNIAITLASEDRGIRAAAAARGMLVNMDARDWIRQIADGTFDWCHWDPPYGGNQDGGAFTTYEQINDTREYARDLHAHMIPEIYRTLKDGRWLAVWCHQSSDNQDYMRKLLQGHELAPDKPICLHCKKVWGNLDSAAPCPKAKTPFWVNPYACIWYKTDRQADGHEITRYLNNDYETFLLAAKWDEQEPVLARSNTSNVLPFNMVPKAERRHIMHKPVPMLREVLSLISYPGELGGDASAGSGSICEAAYESGRQIRACELSKNIYVDAITAIKERILASNTL